MNADHEHRQDTFITNGVEELREPRIIEGHEELTTHYDGSICVHEGAEFTLAAGAGHSGSLTFRPGSAGYILGKHSGSLHVAPTATVEVAGDQSGSVHIDSGGFLKVEKGGKLAGSLHVAGQVENRGVRGGSVHLAGGEIRDLDTGTVKEPVVKNGMSYYRW
ncbi:hypothetical protein [Arthrobacter sp. FW306-06-A]|uniref:hypothetical protein n=1 Tax=Arthrobacter sp. FW306-06-A TaxID=2879621 RepID=UPI001F25AB69|nr:hypothetical protein [Arthrobacter sp. FW306-06-A]UKA73392.1 hypothetical protein LFT49_21600 [Arthrobacter sp. FW306-06-A]